MKAGVVYPQIELGGDTGAVKAFAQAAEDLGYDHIVIYDHVLGAVHADREPKLTGPYKETDPFHEPLVTYAYLAGVTKTLGLATGVIILPQRQTALFAKQAADVDLFSDGRLRLGVGIGWNWVEYDGLEMSRHFRRRGKRQEQQIALIRKLWGQPVVEHEDSDHRIDRAGILPRPKRQIPIWFGRGQPMARRYRGVARCRRKPHICRDDGREPHHSGRSHRSDQALAQRLQLDPLEFRGDRCQRRSENASARGPAGSVSRRATSG
jgi:probable F420-dependent oxidoreductase